MWKFTHAEGWFVKCASTVHNQLGILKSVCLLSPKQLKELCKTTCVVECPQFFMLYCNEGENCLKRIMIDEIKCGCTMTPWKRKRYVIICKHSQCPVAQNFHHTVCKKAHGKKSPLGSLRHSFDWLPGPWIHNQCWKPMWNNDEDQGDNLLQTSRIPDSGHDVALQRHSSHCCINKLVHFNQWEALKHSPYNPDLATSNFHLLGPSRQYLHAGHCNTNADVQWYVQCTGKTKNTDVLGDHAEKW